MKELTDKLAANEAVASEMQAKYHELTSRIKELEAQLTDARASAQEAEGKAAADSAQATQRIDDLKALVAEGKFEDAVKMAEKLAAGDAHDKPHVIFYALGDALHALGNEEEAVKRYAQAVFPHLKYSDSMYKWAVALVKLGRYEEALGRLQVVAELQPKNADVLLLAGRALQKLRSLEKGGSFYAE